MLTLAREFAASVRDQAARAVVQARIALAQRDQHLLDQALQAARSCDRASAAITLAKIAGLLPAEEAVALIREANQIVDSLPEPSPLTKLQERVDSSGIPTRDESAAIVAARVLAAGPHHLPDAVVDSAAERAREIEDWGVRAELLAALSRGAEPTLAAQLFHQAEGEIGLISGWIDKLQGPGWTMIPHEIERRKRQLITALTAVAATATEVDEGLLQQLLAAANAEESSAVAASILDQLPARCHERTRAPTALALAGGLTNPIVRRWALGYFDPPPAPDLGRIAATLDALASRQRNELLGDLGCLGPLLASTCTADSAEELMGALDQVTLWWP